MNSRRLTASAEGPFSKGPFFAHLKVEQSGASMPNLPTRRLRIVSRNHRPLLYLVAGAGLVFMVSTFVFMHFGILEKEVNLLGVGIPQNVLPSILGLLLVIIAFIDTLTFKIQRSEQREDEEESLGSDWEGFSIDDSEDNSNTPPDQL